MNKAFLTYAAGILGDTHKGFSGRKIVDFFAGFSIKNDVKVPYDEYPFGISSKNTVIADNLEVFDDYQKFEIIKYMCQQLDTETSKELLAILYEKYSHLDAEEDTDGVNYELIEQTKHWLSSYAESYKIFTEAIEKQKRKVYQRNVLDDLRLSLELLLKQILINDKSLENQIPIIGEYLKSKNTSKELNNMFVKLIDYFTKYQNSYVKHADNVNQDEIDFMIEITASFMKHFIRLHKRA